MELPSDPSAHPGVLVREACATLGTDVVVDWCADLLTGRIDVVRAVEDKSLPSLAWLGGRSTLTNPGWALDPVNHYWVRVWAARAFLYVWRDDVVEAFLTVLSDEDEHWRVKHDVARVVVARSLGEAVPLLVPMLHHRLPRVREVAARAIGVAGESEHAAALADLRFDDETSVRAAAELALERLSTRLDRSIEDLLEE